MKKNKKIIRGGSLYRREGHRGGVGGMLAAAALTDCPRVKRRQWYARKTRGNVRLPVLGRERRPGTTAAARLGRARGGTATEEKTRRRGAKRRRGAMQRAAKRKAEKGRKSAFLGFAI